MAISSLCAVCQAVCASGRSRVADAAEQSSPHLKASVLLILTFVVACTTLSHAA